MGLLSSSSTFLFRLQEHDVSSPLSGGDQIVEFCESPAELLLPGESKSRIQQNSEEEEEVGSCSSNCCYDDIIKYPATSIHNNTDNLSIIDQHDDVINSAVKNLRNLPTLHDQFHLLQNPAVVTTTDNHNPITPYPHHQNDHPPDHVIMGPAALMPSRVVCEDVCCLSSTPPSKLLMMRRRFNDSSLNLYLSAGNSNPPPAAVDHSGIFGGNNFFFLGSELEYFNADGIFNSPHPPLPTPPNYNSNQLLQALSNEESQHLVNGGASSATTPILTTEITSLEEAETYRSVAACSKLTTQERRAKIHRYMKKETTGISPRKSSMHAEKLWQTAGLE